LENLKELCLDHNSLTSLPDDLFINMKRLTRVGFCSNGIEKLSPRLLDPIPDGQWELINFSGNKVINAYYCPSYKIAKNSLKSVQEMKNLMDLTNKRCTCPCFNCSGTERITPDATCKELWEYENSTDFMIVTATKKIPASKRILVPECPGIAAMIKNGENELDLKDFKNEIVEEFLQTVYTLGISDKYKKEDIMDLYSLACKFQAGFQMEVYEEYVIDSLDEENAVKALKIGNLYGSESVIDAAFAKIKSVYGKSIKSNDLKHKPDVVEEIIKSMKK
jgi:BTB/POZ domain/Leucine rich repeat